MRAELFTGDEAFEWVELGDDADESVIAFRRGSGVVCAVNYGSEPAALPAGQVLLASGPGVDGTLPGETAAWIRPR